MFLLFLVAHRTCHDMPSLLHSSWLQGLPAAPQPNGAQPWPALEVAGAAEGCGAWGASGSMRWSQPCCSGGDASRRGGQPTGTRSHSCSRVGRHVCGPATREARTRAPEHRSRRDRDILRGVPWGRRRGLEVDEAEAEEGLEAEDLEEAEEEPGTQAEHRRRRSQTLHDVVRRHMPSQHITGLELLPLRSAGMDATPVINADASPEPGPRRKTRNIVGPDLPTQEPPCTVSLRSLAVSRMRRHPKPRGENAQRLVM